MNACSRLLVLVSIEHEPNQLGRLQRADDQVVLPLRERNFSRFLSRALARVDLILDAIGRYPSVLPAIEDTLRPGGLLSADNKLWSGKIFHPADASRDTEGIRRFAELITACPRWIASLVSIRDGVTRFGG